jgi:hypothetical protein
LARLREFIESLDNVQTIGRNGLHRYDNQDHAMLTGMLAARSLVLGHEHDLWSVNTDREYHEEVHEESGETLEDLAARVLPTAFARLHRGAFGMAIGLCCGLLLMTLTAISARTEYAAARPLLDLLGQYFPGYQVGRAGGPLRGLAYGFGAGFTLGWSAALLRNAGLGLTVTLLRRKGERRSLRNLLDYL